MTLLHQASIRPKKYPPGPPCIAFLGSLPYLDVKNLSKSFSDLAKKHGDIFSIFIGRTPVVVVNGWHLIKEVFERPEFSGRPGNFSGTFFQKGKTGITTTEGKHWSAQRKFLVDYLTTVTGSGQHGFQVGRRGVRTFNSLYITCFCSVADPGCLSEILIFFHPVSQKEYFTQKDC
jgi:hypothetical protein